MTGGIAVVHGEAELYDRTAHLFASAGTLSCAANELVTWVAAHRGGVMSRQRPSTGVRKLFRLGALLDPAWAGHVEAVLSAGARVRLSRHEVNETILLDDRVAILAGDRSRGPRGYTVVTEPQLLSGITSLFEAAWESGDELSEHAGAMAELRAVAPGVADALNRGWTDDAAARELGMSVRTYRRRVAELMAALGASSRFQAGARARELGLL
ncbi:MULTISPECIES: response regulator transcription factor [Actinosynnema]|uniref:LuxR family transcriptional regulator n=1 Tax=Actinosynnema pretiosum TaxID=42197 RepID=A0A290ZF38_9PSEU|nr:response regulator transcription factor [Actinosynnema pretiosum]ATE57583.1 LuxR family transcriptional regulator [Actinosynnema pretiosum]